MGLEKLILTDPRKDHIINHAANLDPDKPGVLVVYAHGRNDAVQDDRNGKENRVSMSASALADQIRSSAQYKEGMPIELRSCDTGKGVDPIAQQLSTQLNTTVIAPDSFYMFNLDGSVGPVNLNWMGQPNRGNPGHMITFNP